MGKYVTDLPSKNPERSVEKIEAYLAKQGFVQSGRPGKEVWKRMSSPILSPEYVSVRPGDGHVHLEAWIRAVTPRRGSGSGRRTRERHAYRGAFERTSPPAARRIERMVGSDYSTVTVLARFRGWSTFSPRSRAIR